MFRRLLAVLAVGLVAASCSSADTLATVNGEAITKDDLIASRPVYEDAIGTVTGENVREDVSGLIVLQATLQAAARDFGVVIDDAAIDERLANPPERYSAILTPAQIADDSNEATQRNRATVTLMIDGVGPPLISGEAGGYDALLADRPEVVTRVCVRHIAVTTIPEVNDVLSRLEAGEDFVALAAELSLDQVSPNGMVTGPEDDCLSWVSGAGEAFANAALAADLNVPVGPVPFDGGFSIIRVEDRIGPASVADLEANFMDFIALDVASARYSSWASNAVATADIEVSPVLGTWSSAGFGISPPPQ